MTTPIFNEYRVRSRLPRHALDDLKGKVLTHAAYDLLINPAGSPVRISKPNGDPLMIYIPGGIDRALRDVAYPILTKIRGQTDNRTHASGSKLVRDRKQWRAAKVTSNILGSYEAASNRFPVCRLTAWTGSHADEFRAIFPYIQAVAAYFGRAVPDRYDVQDRIARDTDPAWVITGTPFTTITVNNTYPTGVHVDDGDLDEGFSCLTVLRRGSYSGGHLVFPEYRVAVDLHDGDVVLMDAHEWHGNVGITKHSGDAERISVVLYYRTGMKKCGSPSQELIKAKRKAGLLLDPDEIAREHYRTDRKGVAQ